MSLLKDLNRHLPLEISAHTRYNGHAQLLKYWGYSKLAERYTEAASEEMGHANQVMFRIQQLGGMPDYLPELVTEPVKGRNIQQMLESDLAVEQKVLDSLTRVACAAAHESGEDWETHHICQHLIADTEADITWYSQQLELIDEIGLQNWLQAQL